MSVFEASNDRSCYHRSRLLITYQLAIMFDASHKLELTESKCGPRYFDPITIRSLEVWSRNWHPALYLWKWSMLSVDQRSAFENGVKPVRFFRMSA